MHHAQNGPFIIDQIPSNFGFRSVSVLIHPTSHDMDCLHHMLIMQNLVLVMLFHRSETLSLDIKVLNTVYQVSPYSIDSVTYLQLSYNTS